MKKILAFSLILVFVSMVSGQVQYNVDADREGAEVDTSIVLQCDEDGDNCPVNFWSFEWTLPKDAEVRSISDSQGVIEDYNRYGDTLKIQTNKGEKRSSEKVQINISDNRDAEEVISGLYTRELSLSGFPNELNTGKVEVEDLVSSKISNGFQTSYSNDSLVYRGEGGGSIKINFGKGNKSKFYTFFGGKKNGSLAYKVSVGTTGLRQSYDKIPVALMDDQVYNRSVSDWSSGEYSSGVVKLRKSLTGSDFQPVLAEETVHAFNSEALSFDKTSSSWLDEGLAGYTQSMVRRRLEGQSRTRTVFGEDTKYIEERNGSRYEITKPSTGRKENLWNYYQRNKTWMKNWNPSKTDQEARRFGYAYAELIIRNHVAQGNNVRQLYRNIRTNETLDSNQEKWNYYQKHIDLTPCRHDSREKFESCLDKVNSYNYTFYSAQTIPEIRGEELRVQELEIPDHSKKNQFASENQARSLIRSLKNFLDRFFEQFL